MLVNRIPPGIPPLEEDEDDEGADDGMPPLSPSSPYCS